MDKVQVVLVYLRKYHFWLLCVVAVVASLLGWMKARGTLSEEYKKEKSTIESKFGSLRAIQGDPNPPNGTWKEAIDKLTDQERQKVASAWKSVYDAQQQVLTWPADILGPQFIEWMKTSKPGDEIRRAWREQYRNDVVNVEFPKLVDIVEAELKIEDDENTTPRGKDADAAARQYKVDWNPESQENVQQALQMADEVEPSSQVVRLRQEDLWVFRALLNIIRDTNESARYSSHVKRINSLSIGAEAAKKFQEGMKAGHIELLQPVGGDTGQEDTVARASLEGGTPAPDADRYVDDSGNPLGPGVAANEQFKRLPVYLNLEMNQNEITRLLTHCANYPLPVEVKQLRINPDSEDKGETRDPDNMSPTALGPLDVTVEIHGIIYIYNPPDPAKLGQPDAAMAGIGG